jgi:hypothetical protein
MPCRIAVFDTNVYYDLSRAAAAELRSSERRAGVVGCASVLVSLEMLARLTDPTDRRYQLALKGLAALREHVTIWDYGDRIPFFGTARDALSVEWFGRPDPVLRSLSDGLGDLIFRATPDAATRDPEVREACARVRAYVDEQEERFGDRLADVLARFASITDEEGKPVVGRKLTKAQYAFHAEHGIRYSAETLALAICARVDGQIEPSVLEKHAEHALSVMPVAVGFLRNELRRFTADGADPRKPENSNTLWDLEHCGHASRSLIPRDARLLGRAAPVLVTNERRIKAAAEENGAADLVLTLSEYRQTLNSGFPCGSNDTSS